MRTIDPNDTANYTFTRESSILWAFPKDTLGEYLFSFDDHKFYHLFGDYPDALSDEEERIFKREQPYWYNFFRK